MAALTQLRTAGLSGARYGSFAGKTQAPIPTWTPGVVPIRFVSPDTANVVPVETVTTNEAGVVPCRIEVGPANVVPVREVTTERPRVKVRLV